MNTATQARIDAGVERMLGIIDAANGRTFTRSQLNDYVEAGQDILGAWTATGLTPSSTHETRLLASAIDSDDPSITANRLREYKRLQARNRIVAGTGTFAEEIGRGRDARRSGDSITERLLGGPREARSILTSTSTSALATVQYWSEFSPYLAAYSAAIESGCRIIDTDSTQLKVPAGTALATGAWLAEGGTATASDMGVTSYTITPTRLTVFSEFSREVLEDSSFNAMDVITEALFDSLAYKLDTAVFQGTGASNEPQGMLNLPSSGTVTGGTPADLSAFVSAMKGAYAANADVKAWALSDTAWGAYAALKVGGTASYDNRPLISQDYQAGGGAIAASILGRPAYVTSNITTTGGTATKAFGYDPDLVWIVRRREFNLVVDPYSKAEQGLVRMILEGRFGVAFPQPKAVRVITPIVVS